MKKIITIFTLGLISFNVNGQAVNDSISMESLYTNQVFYSLDNGEVSNINNNDWELGFSADGDGAAGSAIILNEATATLWAYPSDTADWNSFDTTGHLSWEQLLNTDTSWTNGAFNVHRGAAGGLDMGWGVLNPLNNYWTFGDSLYLAKLSDNSFRKIWIVSLKTGVWEYKYANVDGSNEQSFTIDKSNYPNKNFVYHSMLTDQVIDREPDNTTWDIMFAKHVDYLSPSGIYQGVTSVFNNRNVWTAKAHETDSATAATSITPQTTFNQNITNIGREWKTYNSSTGWAVYDSIAYFAFDNDSTNFYRIVFTGFGGLATGKAYFNTEMLQTVSVVNYKNKIINFSVYPNPATDNVTLLMDYYESSNMNISTVDLSGKMVYNEVQQLISGINQKTININQLKSGIYILRLQNDQLNSTRANTQLRCCPYQHQRHVCIKIRQQIVHIKDKFVLKPASLIVARRAPLFNNDKSISEA